MSWIESVNRDYTITTGDGVRFTVNWLTAVKSKDFNVSVFNFKGVKGSLVDRREPMGRIYDIEVFFQGEDCLIRSDDFDKSSDDKRAWTISHPIYGAVIVQPLNLKFDNSQLNVTKITGQIVETIGTSRIVENVSPVDVIKAKKLSTDLTSAQSYIAEVPIPNALDISNMKTKVTTAEKLQVAFATIQEDAQAATNTYYAANAAIDRAASDAFSAIRATQAVLDLPANFVNTVVNRLDFLKRTADALYDGVTGLNTRRLKKLYENVIGTNISTMCSASVTNVGPTDYRYRRDVVQVIDTISTAYNEYIANLDTIQSDNGADTDSYIPDFQTITDLGNLVHYTISNLFSIADNAKQQRTITLSKDNNLVTLAWELYGLQPDDSTIEQLKNDNNISLKEVLQIKKDVK